MNDQIDYQKIYEYEHKNSSGYQLNNWGLFHINFWLSYFNFSSVIEIGCGNGKLLDRLVQMNSSLMAFGVDVIGDNIYNNQDYAYLQLNILKSSLPYSDRSFDLGICFDVFEHLSNSDFAIKELIRVSKSQVIAVPHSKSVSIKGQELHLTVESAQWWLKKLCGLSKDEKWEMIHIHHICNSNQWIETSNPCCNRTLYLRRIGE